MADAKVIPLRKHATRHRTGARRPPPDPAAPRNAPVSPRSARPPTAPDRLPTTRPATPPRPPPRPAGSLEALTAALGGAADRLLGGSWDRKVADGLAFLRRRLTGDYEVDEFGYDAELTDQVLMPLVRPLYEKYFRVEVRGIENIPAEGGALVVANHSGSAAAGRADDAGRGPRPPSGRPPPAAARRGPGLRAARSSTSWPARPVTRWPAPRTRERLLERGEVVGVMPEGFKGTRASRSPSATSSSDSDAAASSPPR